jgi:hypothetical protein
MRPRRKEIGLAVIGCGTIGRIRARIARDYPGVGWLGLPVLAAEEAATLDWLSDGNYVLGAGLG